jgi:hypothetical protein
LQKTQFRLPAFTTNVLSPVILRFSVLARGDASCAIAEIGLAAAASAA